MEAIDGPMTVVSFLRFGSFMLSSRQRF